jgi:hypothetical protein
MGRKARLWLLVLGGLSLVALSLVADAVGIGSDYVFGWEQKLGVVVGMSAVWFGTLRLAGWSPAWNRREPARDAKHIELVSA